MNGGLADQLLSKARRHLDRRLTVESSPEELCALTMADFEHAAREIGSAPVAGAQLTGRI
jgi:hypothetical protein